MPGTVDNLMEAIKNETYETTTMYKNFAKTAHEEGFHALGNQMAGVGAIEKLHRDRYHALLKDVKAGVVFKRNKPIV
jgi:rubrerythrin